MRRILFIVLFLSFSAVALADQYKQNPFTGRQDNVGSAYSVNNQYSSVEYDNGVVTGTDTIDWNNGNVQYVSMSGNTVFTFSNPVSVGGGRYVVHLKGPGTPTLPATVRYPAGTTPTWTATANKKDIVTCVYSAKQVSYDCVAVLNFQTN